MGESPFANCYRIGNVETDPQGRFAFEGTDVTTYTLRLEHESLALYNMGIIQIKKPDQVVDDLVLKVGPGASISGRVYDVVTGQGLQGVKLLANGGPRSVETNKEGEYQLAALSGDRAGLSLSSTGLYINLHEVSSGQPRYVELRRGHRTKDIDFPLEKGIVLKGIVVNEAGEPIVGGDVQLEAHVEGQDGMAWAKTQIGPDGQFALEGVPAGMREGGLTVTGTRAVNDPEDRVYWPHHEQGKLAAWTEQRRFVLDQEARVCGTALDSSTGSAITSFEVFAAPGWCSPSKKGWRETYKPVQDPQGRFCSNTYRGNTSLFVRADGYVPGFVRVGTPRPAETVETEFRLVPGGVIEGTVTNWIGETIEGACIFDGLPPEGDMVEKDLAALAHSDVTGHFRATVSPGKRVFSAWTEETGSDQLTVSVEAGETSNVNFTLGNGARISGLITANGEPVSVWVRYAIQPDAAGTSSRSRPVTRPNSGEEPVSNGRFRLAGLPAGHGTLTILLTPPTGTRREKVIDIETTDGRETVADYDFPTISTTITGMVQIDGEPIPSASIVAYVKGQPGPLGTSSAVVLNGAYEISTELGGQITLAVSIDSPTGTYMHREAVEVEPRSAVEHDINIVTGAGATIEGQIIQVDLKIVLHDVQTGLVEGTLRMEDREFEQYYMTTALAAYAMPDENGHFRFEDIPDGAYTLVLKGATPSSKPWYAFNGSCATHSWPGLPRKAFERFTR